MRIVGCRAVSWGTSHFEYQPTRHLVLYYYLTITSTRLYRLTRNHESTTKTERRTCKGFVIFRFKMAAASLVFLQLRTWTVLVKFGFFKYLYWPSKRELYFDFSVRHFVCECREILDKLIGYNVQRRRNVFIRIFLYPPVYKWRPFSGCFFTIIKGLDWGLLFTELDLTSGVQVY